MEQPNQASLDPGIGLGHCLFLFLGLGLGPGLGFGLYWTHQRPLSRFDPEWAKMQTDQPTWVSSWDSPMMLTSSGASPLCFRIGRRVWDPFFVFWLQSCLKYYHDASEPCLQGGVHRALDKREHIHGSLDSREDDRCHQTWWPGYPLPPKWQLMYKPSSF